MLAKRPAEETAKRNVRRKQSPAAMVFKEPSASLTLDEVRNDLIRMEETIIFALIERAQFARNAPVYCAGEKSLLAGAESIGPDSPSYVEWMLAETEKLHAQVGRYTSPDENPFLVKDDVAPLLPQQNYPVVLKPNCININARIMNVYKTRILPGICPVDSDDGQYGSSAVSDIAILQSLSKRVHFGKFVAEAKFRRERDKYTKLIKARDSAGLMRELTKPEVEAKILRRVELKASTYGMDPQAEDRTTAAAKVQPSLVAALYCDWVMPLNKDVQVSYLLQRLNAPSVTFAGPTESPCHGAALLHFGPAALVSSDDIRTAFAAVMGNKVAHAVVPIETKAGGVSRATQAQLLATGLFISAERFYEDERFLVVSKQFPGPTGHDKTTLCFGLAHTAGSLAEALRTFAARAVNLTFIESIPAQAAIDRYDFYVELDGHVTDANVAAAISDLKAGQARYIKHLGSCTR